MERPYPLASFRSNKYSNLEMGEEVSTNGFRQFLILLYKGLLLRKRHYIITVFEIIIPIIVAIIPVIIESEVRAKIREFEREFPENHFRDQMERPNEWINASFYDPFNPLEYQSGISGDLYVLYTPGNDLTNKFAEDTIKIWNGTNNNTYYAYSIRNESIGTEAQLEDRCIELQQSKPYANIIGIVFNDFNGDKLPDSLNYKIRYKNTFFTNLKYQINGPQEFNVYNSTIFLSWQAAVERTFIEQKMSEKGKSFPYKLLMNRFPYPGHKKDNSDFNTINIVPLCIGYGFFIFIINLVKRVTEEKRNKSKELLKMMGMKDIVYWTSTFINFFSLGAIAMLITAIIYKSPMKNSFVFLANTDFMLLLIILLLFMAHLILFCLAFTTFFNRPVFAIVLVVILQDTSLSVLSTLLFMPMNQDNYFQIPLAGKLALCLLPSGSLLTIFNMVSTFESNGVGAKWSNLTAYGASFDVNLLMVLGTMVFACFLYIVIIWYIDAVWPWQPGVPKPFYFPFTKTYWCGYEENVEEDLTDLIKEKDTEMFEEEPAGVTAGVVIRNLSKAFGTGMENKLAVNNLSLNIYNGQITALLGPNGAGKTTTIHILTGLYTPTSGSATVNGWNILKETTKARRSLGVCPQENVLYDTLTVEEHLKIYAGLKGVEWKNLSNDASEVLKILQLTDKKNELIKNLSGGMKRKLSLGIALIGGSKVLFLDEPTSGMDVEARRSVWDALLSLRHNRTIILTTHYMEEADILGDRVAIMAEGEVQCCGSPMFLKRKLGTGYHLHLVKDINFNQHAVRELIQKHVPTADPENEIDKEITFNLGTNQGSSFAEMFEELEKSKQILGINSCGITVTTMEDVFLNVSITADVKSKNIQSSNSILTQNGQREYGDHDVYSHSRTAPARASPVQQVLGLLIKRFHYTKRHWLMLVAQLIIPFLMLCVCFAIISSTSYRYIKEYAPLKLDISDIYGHTIGFYQTNENPEEFTSAFKQVMAGNHISFEKTDNPTELIVKTGETNILTYLKDFLVGGSVMKHGKSTELTAWFNGEPYHGMPISLLLMNTALLRHVSGTGSITLTNAPLPSAQDYSFFSASMTGILAAVFVPLALAFLTASFVMVPIQERTSKAKLLQLMTGLHETIYWLAMFIWDFLVHSVICILLIIPFAIFSSYAFFSPHSEAIGTVLLMMFLYSWASIPFSYIFSLIFKKPNTGFSVVITICVIMGTAVGSIINALEAAYPKAKAARWVFRLFPSFCLSSGFSNLFAIAFNNAFCEGVPLKDIQMYCNNPDRNPSNPLLKCCTGACGTQCLVKKDFFTMEAESCGRDLLFLAIDGAIYISLLLFFESTLFRIMLRNLRRISKRIVTPIQRESINEDSDVLAEEERIRNALDIYPTSDALLVKDLSKTYRNFYAVDHLTFGIRNEECFGLLGVNGAGKTTTFQMLTGDCVPTEGNAVASECSLLTNLKQFQSRIGYCPQFDALIDRLTGREMITLFARLRGMSGPTMFQSIEKLIKMTDLTKHADKQTRFYSGGNKRKLSIALSLIASPPLILLDEPTAGVDPVSRRKIWNILAQARSVTGAAIILTTHSMEESEALCSRLAIMVNGRFRCLGSIQQLKSKFGQGYTVIIKMKKETQNNPQAVVEIKNYIENSLMGSQLKDDHQGMLQYHVVNPAITLSYLFKFMDQTKTKFDLEDYLLSDTSLEQIFLTFARAQRIVASSS